MDLFLRGFKKGIYNFSELVSVLFNAALLLLVYCCILGPTAIIAKITRKKFLQSENSGWQNIDEKEPTEESFYRQF
jgi:hypothetical protein